MSFIVYQLQEIIFGGILIVGDSFGRQLHLLGIKSFDAY
jgi:hypothetical protein